MFSTAALVAIFGTVVLGQWLLSAWLLRIGTKWARLPIPSYKRAVVTILLLTFIPLPIDLGLNYLSPSDNRITSVISMAVITISVLLLVQWKIVQWMLKATFGKAIIAWLPVFFSSIVGIGISWGVIRPYFVEAFSITSNSMAPTFLGFHIRARCPNCGGVGIISATSFGREQPRPVEPGICSSCFKTLEMPLTDMTRQGSDRVLVSKFFHAKRWDAVVYRLPESPSTLFVHRLVGLPGDELAIRDGDVWINGQRRTKPDSLAGLYYVADMHSNEFEPQDPSKTWGPVRLGGDEYFVLGDNSFRSKDSRLWQGGVPGHPPYAVPESHLVGVVTHIYWPPSRWRIIR